MCILPQSCATVMPSKSETPAKLGGFEEHNRILWLVLVFYLEKIFRRITMVGGEVGSDFESAPIQRGTKCCLRPYLTL